MFAEQFELGVIGVIWDHRKHCILRCSSWGTVLASSASGKRDYSPLKPGKDVVVQSS